MDKVYNIKGVNVAKIKTIAKEQGKTMKFLCDLIGKDRSFLTCVRNGNNHIDNQELQIIADELNTTVEYLTDQTEQKEKPIDQMTDEQIDMELVELLTSLDADDIRAVKAFIAGLKAGREN